MCRITGSVFLLLVCLTVLAEPMHAAEKQLTKEAQSVSQSNSQFAFDLYQRLCANEGNRFISPTSISAALAMAYAGAEGDTEKEMANTLRFTLPDEQLHPAFASLMATLSSPNKETYELRVANRLWGQRGYGFLPRFLATTRKEYDAELAQVDFVAETDRTRQEINAWVETQTNDKIKDLIPPGTLNEMTRLVLTNAVYFKGKWEFPFDQDRTSDQPFTISDGNPVEVPLMYQKEKFKFGETKDLQLLEMPYAGGELAMLILLPKKPEGLPALEKQLTFANLENWSKEMRFRKVLTYVPRFRLTDQFELSSILSALGMPLAFDSRKADFSGINGQRDLFLSAALHKAFVEVTEEGTEAAAATGIVIGTTSVEISPTFRADHPFVFLIRHKQSGSILFLGRVTDPRG